MIRLYILRIVVYNKFVKVYNPGWVIAFRRTENEKEVFSGSIGVDNGACPAAKCGVCGR